MRQRYGAIVIAAAALWATAGPAGAHGILHHAVPAPDSTVKEVPAEVEALLTEAPVPDGRFVVRDGCGDPVNEGFEVDDRLVTAAIAGAAQPGGWKVRFDFISKVDGHRYAESFSFRVTGKRDCSADAAASEDESGDTPYQRDAPEDAYGEASVADTAPRAHETTPASDAGGFPVLPVALGSLALVGVALAVRRSVSS